MPINKGAIRAARENKALALQAPRFDDVLREVRTDHEKSVAKVQTLRDLADKLAATVHSCRATLGAEHTAQVLAKYGRNVTPTKEYQNTRLAKLPSIDAARADLRDLLDSDLFTQRYCTRSGVSLGMVSGTVVRQLGAMLQNEKVAMEWLGTFSGSRLLSFHGLSPLWVRTDNLALMMLRRIDPAGYVTYLAHYWCDGVGQADTLGDLQSRIECRERLADDPELADKISLFEICAKSGFKTGEVKTLQAIRDGASFETLRDKVASWLVKELGSLVKQGDEIDGTLAALARSRIANHGYKAMGIPRHIAMIQRAAERRTIASTTLQDQYDIAALLGGAGHDVPPLALSQIAHTEHAARKLDLEQQRALADVFGAWDVAENYEIRTGVDDDDTEDDILGLEGFGLADDDHLDDDPITDHEFMQWAEAAEEATQELTARRKHVMNARQVDKDEETLSVVHGDIFGDIDFNSL